MSRQYSDVHYFQKVTSLIPTSMTESRIRDSSRKPCGAWSLSSNKPPNARVFGYRQVHKYAQLDSNKNIRLLWSHRHVRRGVYSGSGPCLRCPIFKVVPQAAMIDSAHDSFPLDIANSPLRSPVRKRPRLESSPSFSELSPLEEQHLSALDEIEKRFTQSQHVHSPSSRRGMLAAPAATNVSSNSIHFSDIIVLNYF